MPTDIPPQIAELACNFTPEQAAEIIRLLHGLYAILAGAVVLGICALIAYFILRPIVYFLY